ncbi:MAG: iron-containing alcohol dehydrogenase [Oscillospiraceae bacterium]|jgi:alcohol dehydrogenase YqhD (iron-dependent ADH family)|nr:iron-containing alcohol dehydrogenase [Oscillospiraceae bacterium]
MINFSFYNPAKIIFGKDTEKQIADEIKKYGSNVLIHYGGGSIKRSGLYDKIIGILDETGISHTELGGVQPNPRLSLVHEGVALCKNNNIQFILAVGGGSTIDSAKAIALGAVYDGDVWDFFEGKANPKESLPIGTVLTIPAAGSESSDAVVVTNEKNMLKRGYNNELTIPKFSVLNPESTFTLSNYQTACGASDILAHLMERYFTNVTHVDLTDRLIEATYKTILNYAPRAIQENNDYDARAEVMWAGCVAHNNLLDTGRIGDWASHSIEHELSAHNDVAHGAGLSIVFPAWMKYVYKENVQRFVQFATRMFDVQLSCEHTEEIILEGIKRLETFYKSLGLPTRLSEIGIGESDIEQLAEKCLCDKQGGIIGNFKKLGKEDVISIYKLAL